MLALIYIATRLLVVVVSSLQVVKSPFGLAVVHFNFDVLHMLEAWYSTNADYMS